MLWIENMSTFIISCCAIGLETEKKKKTNNQKESLCVRVVAKKNCDCARDS